MKYRKNSLLISVLVCFMMLALLMSSFQTEAAAKVVTLKSSKGGVTFTYKNLKYKVTKISKGKGTVAVTGIKKYKKKVTIPTSIKARYKKDGKNVNVTLKVTSIAPKAFLNNQALEELTIGKYVEKIGKEAFMYCYYLKKVNVKKAVNLKTIGSKAFSGDYQLKTFDFKALKKLDTVSDDAFSYSYYSSFQLPYEKYASVKKLAKAAAKYKYTVEPLVAPFNNYFYVRTNNKKPNSFRFVDNNTKLKNDYNDNILNLDENTYLDVKYENRALHRVKGGYIFYVGSDSVVDGGNLTLQVNSKYGWVDTSVNVLTPTVTDEAGYLYKNLVVKTDSFDKNMKRVVEKLKDAYINSVSVYDSTKYAGKERYPYLTGGYYGYDDVTAGIYNRSNDGLLTLNCYPFYNSSSNLKAVALKLDPKCKVTYSYYGGVSVTQGGKTYTYSVDNYSYNRDVIFKKYVEQSYKFDDSDRDAAGIYSYSNLNARISKFIEKSEADQKKLENQIAAAKGYSRIGHAKWVRIYGGDFIYYTQGTQYLNGYYGYKSIRDTWVDGRYINSKGVYEKGARFTDHPKADIMITNMTYKNYFGEKVTGDVTYNYDSATGTWRSEDYLVTGYAVNSWSSTYLKDGEELPGEFILTKDEVKAMKIGKNTNVKPQHGIIIDGTVVPGTKF